MEALRNWGPSIAMYFILGAVLSPLSTGRWVVALLLVAAVDVVAYLRGLSRS
jgi:hypothetical protein